MNWELVGVVKWLGQFYYWWKLDLAFSVVVQLQSHVWLFTAPWTAACQPSLSFTVSQRLLKFMSIELVMPSNHLVLNCPLLLLPSIFLSIQVFSSKPALRIRWPSYWSFSINPSKGSQCWLSLGLTDLISLLSKGLSKSLLQHHSSIPQFFGAQLSLWSNSHTHIWLLEKP